MKLGEIISVIEESAPLKYQEPYDNSGLILGDPNGEISKVLVCLDIDEKAMDHAVKNGCQLIISHHPMVFRAIKVFTNDVREARLLTGAIKHNIALYSAHTNFDSAAGGLTDLLCKRIGIKDAKVLKGVSEADGFGPGRYGTILPVKDGEFLKLIMERLKLKALRYVGGIPQYVSKVAVFNGAYDGDILAELIKIRPDALITGDLKYHDAQMLLSNNIFTIDAGHYGTEKHFAEEMASILQSRFPDLDIISYEGEDVFEYFQNEKD